MNINEFLEIEKKYDLYQKKIRGIYCWQYVRFQLWNYTICKEKLGLADSASKSSAFRNCVNLTKSCLFLLLHPRYRKVRKSKLCFITHERRVKTENAYECIYTDELNSHYMHEAISIERPFRMNHLKPCLTENIYYTDFIHIKMTLYFYWVKVFKKKLYTKIETEVQNHFLHALTEIKKQYDLQISTADIQKKLVRSVLEGEILRKEYGKLLDKIQPQIIVEVVGYAKHCMIINDLAKERNIKTIELQHGTMHADHAAYHYAYGVREIAYFPDVIFTFSDYWKCCICVPIDATNIVAVGYPYFERKLEQYPKVPHDKKTILFISQGTIGTELSKLAAELFLSLDSSKYRIIYKLHPEEYNGWRDKCPWLCQEGIEVVDSLEHNIYEYFAQSDIQVGAYSTAIYEGLGFGLQTYIYQVGHADTMKGLCEQGYAAWVRSAEELSDLIKTNIGVEQPDTEGFWKRNALQNMKGEIGKHWKDVE